MKVRVWDTNARHWVDALTLTIHTSGNFINMTDGFVFMWSIGLKDRHERDIYDGDIVVADWCWDGPHVIVWPNDYYAWTEYSLHDANVEVIGNVYEHPELLETPKGE